MIAYYAELTAFGTAFENACAAVPDGGIATKDLAGLIDGIRATPVISRAFLLALRAERTKALSAHGAEAGKGRNA